MRVWSFQAWFRLGSSQALANWITNLETLEEYCNLEVDKNDSI